MGKYKEIQIEVSDEVYSALEQLADDLNKAETIILNRTGKQELIGQRSMTVEHIALLECLVNIHAKELVEFLLSEEERRQGIIPEKEKGQA